MHKLDEKKPKKLLNAALKQGSVILDRAELTSSLLFVWISLMNGYPLELKYDPCLKLVPLAISGNTSTKQGWRFSLCSNELYYKALRTGFVADNNYAVDSEQDASKSLLRVSWRRFL